MDWEGFELGSVQEANTIRSAEVKPMDGAALSPGGKANRSIYAAPGSTVGSGACLLYLYTNSSSMKNKRDKLEASVLSRSYDISGISEIWQDKTHSWSAGMEGYQ